MAWLQCNQKMSGRDFSQCMTPCNVWPIGELRLGCDGHASRYAHRDDREALREAPNELGANLVSGSDVAGCRAWRLQAILAVVLMAEWRVIDL